MKSCRALAFAAAFAAHSAVGAAPTSYEFLLTGSGQRVDSQYTCTNWAAIGYCPTVNLSWSGLMRVTLADDADGVYTRETLADITMDSNLYSFSVDGFNSPDPYVLGSQDALVTVANGQISSIDFARRDLYEAATFSGLSVVYTAGSNTGPCKGCSSYNLSGTLQPVPEPASIALMLAGLGVLLTGRKLVARRSAAAPR